MSDFLTSHRRRRWDRYEIAFTLPELLVVITIIAILASLLLPVISDGVYHMAFPLDISPPPRSLVVGDPFQRYEGTEPGSVVLGNGMSVIGDALPRRG